MVAGAVRPETGLAVERYLLYYAEVRRIHQELSGSPLREYKPTEPDRLADVFESLWGLGVHGAPFLGEVLHRLVWSQCLGNANHRTAILFLEAFLDAAGFKFPHYADETGAPDRFRVQVERYSEWSHRRLDRQSEFGYNPRQLEEEHRRFSVAWSKRWWDLSRASTRLWVPSA